MPTKRRKPLKARKPRKPVHREPPALIPIPQLVLPYQMHSSPFRASRPVRDAERDTQSLTGRQPRRGDILASVEADALWTPPRYARMEARQLPKGFEVLLRDERLCPDGKTIATGNVDYDAQTFCEIIVSYFGSYQGTDSLGRYQVMDFRPDAWRQARVTGERGLKASMLKLAFTRGFWSDTDCLCSQSDASLALLETIAGDVLRGEWLRICVDIGCLADSLRIKSDILTLLERYGLPPSAAGVKGLREPLQRDRDERRRLGQEQFQKEAGLAIQTHTVKQTKDPDDEIDEQLARHGLTVPHPRGHPDREWAANMTIYEHLHDATTPEAIARDDRIDTTFASLSVALPFPRGHPLRPHAWFEVLSEHRGARSHGWIPFKPPPPADTWTVEPQAATKATERSTRPSKGSTKASARSKAAKR